MATREDALRQHLAMWMRGVEIGPFYSPIVPKSAGWNTIVVDFTDGAALRAIAKSHSSQAIREREPYIEEVDIVWDGTPLDTLCLAAGYSELDYIVASHVIEHLPDLIGFLQQCSRLLGPNGVISLAVPDMRKCFDMLKSPTNTSHLLAAFREKRTRHTPETLFEARAYAVQRGGQAAWLEGTDTSIELQTGILHAWDQYKLETTTASGYIDAHAWYFTPSSFALCMLELSLMNLIDFTVRSTTTNPGAEFIAHLRRGRVHPGPDTDQHRLSLMLSHKRELFEAIET